MVFPDFVHGYHLVFLEERLDNVALLGHEGKSDAMGDLDNVDNVGLSGSLAHEVGSLGKMGTTDKMGNLVGMKDTTAGMKGKMGNSELYPLSS